MSHSSFATNLVIVQELVASIKRDGFEKLFRNPFKNRDYRLCHGVPFVAVTVRCQQEPVFPALAASFVSQLS